MSSKTNKVFFSMITVPFLLCPSISNSSSSSNIELNQNFLEEQVRRGLEACIETFEEHSTPWYAFRDALDELNGYGTTLLVFQPSALEMYGVEQEEHICYIANQNAHRLNTIFFEEEPVYISNNN
ncbi:MAG: hypothetical protein LAT82_00470 [Nanoarchaeota archaeon]|nr:hypothetical protein [Nanoarchaeota archaeon]